jgi:arylformamidase
MPRASRLIDVSVLLRPGIPTYPGNQPFEFEPVKRISQGASSNVSKVVMGTHAGTHVAAPKHFFDDKPGVDALPLDLLIGRARVIDVPVRGGITEAHLSPAGLREDLRVPLRTPNSRLWSTNDGLHEDCTYLAESGARYLVDQGVKVVGIDYLSVEQFHKAGAPAHHALLGNNVVIIEALDLSQAEAGHYEMYCLPLRIEGADGAPARVVLKR